MARQSLALAPYSSASSSGASSDAGHLPYGTVPRATIAPVGTGSRIDSISGVPTYRGDMKELMRPSGGGSVATGGARAMTRDVSPQSNGGHAPKPSIDLLGDNVKEGYVLRLFPGSWKKVYLVLQRPMAMAQFKSHKLLDGKPEECVSLSSSTVEPHACDSRERPFTFTVVPSGGNAWQCSADSRDELNEWIRALTELGVMAIAPPPT